MSIKKIALIGNPNSGKSSLFNQLTGLNQKVANFSGVTVEKKEGIFLLNEKNKCTIVDLPGTYSLFPKKEDEELSCEYIFNNKNNLDLVLVTVDASNLKRNLLFCSQVVDLKVPVMIVLTMMDIAKTKKIEINKTALQRLMNVPIVEVNPRKNKNIGELKKMIEIFFEHNTNKRQDHFIPMLEEFEPTIKAIQSLDPKMSPYVSAYYAVYPRLAKDLKDNIIMCASKTSFNKTRFQAYDIQERYKKIDGILKQSVIIEDPVQKEIKTHRLDNILLHRIWGYWIMFFVLFVMFQSVFWLAEFPMQGIEYLFAQSSVLLNTILPPSIFTDFLTGGILAGLSGILVFIPQIAILTGLITFLEDSGYMARISFLGDKTMRHFGLNGKSIIPLISGLACAVPAIMGSRNIENKKEKLLTIFILPLITCSARLPVFTMLIGLVVPRNFVFGVISLQGLVLMGFYLLGFLLALMMAFILKIFIKTKEKSFFILELPYYKSPRWQNLIFSMYDKTKIFVFNAGKIIMIISIVLWVLSSFGPVVKDIKKDIEKQIIAMPDKKDSLIQKQRTLVLENSYAGVLGKALEPVIQPLGFDWKIGIALITSFAAREVFVGTMATLYSLDADNEETLSLQKKLLSAKRTDGLPIFSLASTFSLILFYLISLQCMSTFAVVKRETKGWTIPLMQMVLYSGLAYIASFIVYNLLK